jgi:hypothetical protein
MDIDDDCTVITDMPLSDEVVDFIEQGIKSEQDFGDWCEENIFELSEIYLKYRGFKDSYTDAQHVLFFTRTIYERDDALEMIRTFVTCQ